MMVFIHSRHILEYFIFQQLLCIVFCGFSPLLEDNVRIELKWPGKLEKDTDLSDESSDNILQIKTADKENYVCTLPSSLTMDSHENSANYDGPSPFNLLKPLFLQITCSYRLEHYWTYELCHGHFLRQYHEENVANKLVQQEYILGKYDLTNYLQEDQASSKNASPVEKLPTTRVNSIELPYWAMNLSDGTVCDLNFKPRFTRVLYVCYEKGSHEIYSLKETSTCEYEVVVLTPLLCKHPAFRAKTIEESEVYCYSVGDSPAMPKKLNTLQRLLAAETKIISFKSSTATLKSLNPDIPKKETEDKPPVTVPHDDKLIEDVLNGDYCLHGGTGWWRYEFCYGKKVQQYHEESDGRRTTILLGKWNIDKHLEWIENNPHKKPKKSNLSKQVSHLYTNGDFCDEAEKHRQVEVKLKCKEDLKHPNSMSLYLLEPKTCEYILTVESPIICSLLLTSDENGLNTRLYS